MELIELLNTRGITYKKTNNPVEILLSCTSGEHEDNTPSLSLNLEKNIFHCWSCGFSGGTTKFLESIGEVVRLSVESKQPYKIKKLKSKIQRIIECDEIELPSERRMFIKEFKGIKSSTLKEFQAFTTQQLQLQNYICFPIYQFGKLKYIEGRLNISSSIQSKYYRQPTHAGTAEILFPLDKIRNTNSVILVEGIFDLLNMWQLGYHNTLCIFGATNFNRKKLEILDRIGVTKVDIMMDSDIPGQIASDKIAALLDTKNIYGRVITLPLGKDPGDIILNEAKEALK